MNPTTPCSQVSSGQIRAPTPSKVLLGDPQEVADSKMHEGVASPAGGDDEEGRLPGPGVAVPGTGEPGPLLEAGMRDFRRGPCNDLLVPRNPGRHQAECAEDRDQVCRTRKRESGGQAKQRDPVGEDT